MTAVCQSCEATMDTSDRTLCRRCLDLAGEALDELPGLLDELETVRLGKTRLTTGKVPKGSRQFWPINPAAMKLHAEVVDYLVDWVDRLNRDGIRFFPARRVGHLFIGPLLPGWDRLPRGYSGSPRQRAAWLTHHLPAIAKRSDAGEFVDRLLRYTGDPGQPYTPGVLVRAVDRDTTSFAGLCPGLRGHHDRQERCGASLFADADAKDVECPKCHEVVDVRENRRRTAFDQDLLPIERVVTVLADIHEPVSPWRITQWEHAGQLTVAGWLHQSAAGSQILPAQRRRADVKLYSLARVRDLRKRLLDDDDDAAAS